MYYYIVYKITNKHTEKQYIGSHKTKDLNDGYMGSGYHIKSAVKKYGTDSFEKEILHIFDNYNDMVLKEEELVTEDFVNGNSYNIVVGGRIGRHNTDSKNPFSGKTHSEETRRIMSERAKNRKRRPCSEETKRKISEKAKGRSLGRKHSEETKRKMKEAAARNKLIPNPKKSKPGPLNPFYGKKHSEEALRKNREKSLGKRWVNNGMQRKQISPELLDQYLSSGWSLGREPKPIIAFID